MNVFPFFILHVSFLFHNTLPSKPGIHLSHIPSSFLRLLCITLSAVVLSVSCLPVIETNAAPRLFGTTGMGGNLSTLVELDPATGNLISTIGPIGYIVNGLTYDKTTSTLYGSTSVNDPAYNGLIEININTGAGSIAGVDEWGLGGVQAITCITVDPTGQMYGFWDPGQDDLVTIDKTTGIATRVGESGLSTFSYGLDFDCTGTLYFLNGNGRYYTVNTATGATTLINDIGAVAHHGKFHPETNLWYGINSTGMGAKSLNIADLTANTFTTVATINNLHTLAFSCNYGITITKAPRLNTTEGGGTAQFDVVLNCPPGNKVTINLSSSDEGEGVITLDDNSNSLSFDACNYSIPQTVTISGIDDGISDGDRLYYIDINVESDDNGYNNYYLPRIRVYNRTTGGTIEGDDIQTTDDVSEDEAPSTTSDGDSGCFVNTVF